MTDPDLFVIDDDQQGQRAVERVLHGSYGAIGASSQPFAAGDPLSASPVSLAEDAHITTCPV